MLNFVHHLEGFAVEGFNAGHGGAPAEVGDDHREADGIRGPARVGTLAPSGSILV